MPELVIHIPSDLRLPGCFNDKETRILYAEYKDRTPEGVRAEIPLSHFIQIKTTANAILCSGPSTGPSAKTKLECGLQNVQVVMPVTDILT